MGNLIRFDFSSTNRNKKKVETHEKLPFYTRGDEIGFYIRFKTKEDEEEFEQTVRDMQNLEKKTSICKSTWTEMEKIDGCYHVWSYQGVQTWMNLWNRYKSTASGIRAEGTDQIWSPAVISGTFIDSKVFCRPQTG